MNCCTSENTETRTEPREKSAGFVAPLANIVETKEGFLLEAELPGVGKDGLEVTVAEGELVIVGRRTHVPDPGEQLYRESRRRDYRRVFELDSSIDTGKISAKLENGVLSVQLPKAESVKPRQITVE